MKKNTLNEEKLQLIADNVVKAYQGIVDANEGNKAIFEALDEALQMLNDEIWRAHGM